MSLAGFYVSKGGAIRTPGATSGEGRWIYSNGCGFVAFTDGLGKWVIWANETPSFSGAGAGDVVLSPEIAFGQWELQVDTNLEVIISADQIIVHDVTPVLTITECV